MMTYLQHVDMTDKPLSSKMTGGLHLRITAEERRGVLGAVPIPIERHAEAETVLIATTVLDMCW